MSTVPSGLKRRRRARRICRFRRYTRCQRAGRSVPYDLGTERLRVLRTDQSTAREAYVGYVSLQVGEVRFPPQVSCGGGVDYRDRGGGGRNQRHKSDVLQRIQPSGHRFTACDRVDERELCSGSGAANSGVDQYSHRGRRRACRAQRSDRSVDRAGEDVAGHRRSREDRQSGHSRGGQSSGGVGRSRRQRQGRADPAQSVDSHRGSDAGQQDGVPRLDGKVPHRRLASRRNRLDDAGAGRGRVCRRCSASRWRSS